MYSQATVNVTMCVMWLCEQYFMQKTNAEKAAAVLVGESEKAVSRGMRATAILLLSRGNINALRASPYLETLKV